VPFVYFVGDLLYIFLFRVAPLYCVFYKIHITYKKKSLLLLLLLLSLIVNIVVKLVTTSLHEKNLLPDLICLRNPIFFVKIIIFPGNFYQVYCVKVVDRSEKLLLLILMPFYWNLIMFLARS
jgi:hypothetical protein